jgi:ADP-ribosylglycohydrolase
MALCLAESLVEMQDFDPVDQLRRYVRWFREGHMSSTGFCFDIGNTTRDALMQFERSGEPYPGPTGECTAGNGSLMRLAPVAMFYANEPERAIEHCGESSRTTHGAHTAVDACRFYGGLLVSALGGATKATLLSELHAPVGGYWQQHDLHSQILAIAKGSYKQKNPPEIKGSGFVVRSLEAALWAFYHGKNFREGALLAVNLGDDADTTGAVYGQIAGAYYGLDGIPGEWLEVLVMRETIYALSKELYRDG